MSTPKQDKEGGEIEISFLFFKSRFPSKDKLYRALTAILFIAIILLFLIGITHYVIDLFSG